MIYSIIKYISILAQPMNVNQTQEQAIIPSKSSPLAASPAARRRWWRPWSWRLPRRLQRAFWLLVALLMVFATIGRNEFSATELTGHAIRMTVKPWDFDLLGWEVAAWREKVASQLAQPAAMLSDKDAQSLVLAYLERAQRMWSVEREINQLLSGEGEGNSAALQQELNDLRTRQKAQRTTVEQIIQNQVGWAIVAEGIEVASRPVPPVLFTFTEPPRNLVVSPRHRIANTYARILYADMSLEAIEASERAIFEEQNLTAYITNIGGLGVFPTMVVDRASLGWVLSTVAHEWAHNYLTLFPLGINYATSSELSIINESVATIVGNELGDNTLRDFYPELAPPEESTDDELLTEGQSDDEQRADALTKEALSEDPPPFDFRAEMRETRLAVDDLLAEGKVEEAEAYMEVRRLRFVENGYPLRVLNQAYFAFHGNYVDSPSSSSPIGPKLERLRELSPNLKTFLQTVRWFTSAEDIDEALGRLEN